MQNSEVFGSRLTLRTPLGQSGNTELVWGGDYNRSAATCHWMYSTRGL